MCILINRISYNVALDGRPHLRTSALLSRGGIPPWTTFLNSYDQTSFLHSLMRTSMTVFTRPRTTRRSRIGPPTQHIYRYILLGLPLLQLQIIIWCHKNLFTNVEIQSQVIYKHIFTYKNIIWNILKSNLILTSLFINTLLYLLEHINSLVFFFFFFLEREREREKEFQPMMFAPEDSSISSD